MRKEEEEEEEDLDMQIDEWKEKKAWLDEYRDERMNLDYRSPWRNLK